MSKVNGVVERFNRTVQEDFIDPNLPLIYNQQEYNNKLVKYMIYYNCLRPHESLNNMTPTNYYISQMKMSNMLWTCTRDLQSKKSDDIYSQHERRT
jgi:putative transposase